MLDSHPFLIVALIKCLILVEHVGMSSLMILMRGQDHMEQDSLVPKDNGL